MTTKPNLAIVDLLIDCRNFGRAEYVAAALMHDDGRPFTAEEHELIGQARRPELDAMLAYRHSVLDFHRQRAEDYRALVATAGPYWSTLPDSADLAEVRAIMPPDVAAELDAICERIAPGEVIR